MGSPSVGNTRIISQHFPEFGWPGNADAQHPIPSLPTLAVSQLGSNTTHTYVSINMHVGIKISLWNIAGVDEL